MDETGFDGKAYRLYGWSRKGQQITGERSGKRWQRTSLLLAQTGLTRFAPMLFSGTCDTVFFNKWLEKCLVPQLTPGQTVIMDNAAIHKSERGRQVLQEAGCELLFLPPYSPDFNPIEKTFGVLKRKRQLATSDTTIDQIIKDFI